MLGFLLLALHLASVPPAVGGVDGRPHNPLAAAGSKPSVFFFISNNCPVCNTYAPEIERIVKAYAGRVAFSLIYCDRDITAKKAVHHAKTFRLDGATIYLDPKATFSEWSNADVTPESVVFSAGGREAYVGRIDDLYYAFGQQHAKAQVHDLRRAIDAVLANKPVPPPSGKPVGCYIEKSLL